MLHQHCKIFQKEDIFPVEIYWSKIILEKYVSSSVRSVLVQKKCSVAYFISSVKREMRKAVISEKSIQVDKNQLIYTKIARVSRIRKKNLVCIDHIFVCHACVDQHILSWLTMSPRLVMQISWANPKPSDWDPLKTHLFTDCLLSEPWLNEKYHEIKGKW